MSAQDLANTAVLVTRPEQQADELVAAIEAAAGVAVRLPVLTIYGEREDQIRQQIERLVPPDIIIFVSANAVSYGWPLLRHLRARVAAIGPATEAALVQRGSKVDIQPRTGFDSEHLLAEPELHKVAGLSIWIVRGDGGRELLAEELGQRGARLGYLPVYRRGLPDYTEEELALAEADWLGAVESQTVVMSVASLENLQYLLSPDGLQRLRQSALVTPSARVLQIALDQGLGCPAALASGPQAGDMVRTMIECRQRQNG